MTIDKRLDPFRGFNFRVYIDGFPEVAAFSEVSGLSVDGDATDYREGTDPNFVRKLTGLRKVIGPIVLKRGMVKNDTLWEWYKSIASGHDERRNGSIMLLNEAHITVITWTFHNGFPNKIEGPSLKASDNAVAIESLEIVHEYLTIELEPAPTSR